MTDLLALADRVEKLTGPDRRMDAAICRIIDLPKCEYPDCLPIVMGRILDRVETGGDDPEVPAYTSSLDAAMSLVPGGMEKELSDLYGIARATVGLNTETGGGHGEHKGGDLVLALCAAVLRALANRSAE